MTTQQDIRESLHNLETEYDAWCTKTQGIKGFTAEVRAVVQALRHSVVTLAEYVKTNTRIVDEMKDMLRDAQPAADDAQPELVLKDGYVKYGGRMFSVVPAARLREMPDDGGVRLQCECATYRMYPVPDSKLDECSQGKPEPDAPSGEPHIHVLAPITAALEMLIKRIANNDYTMDEVLEWLRRKVKQLRKAAQEDDDE